MQGRNSDSMVSWEQLGRLRPANKADTRIRIFMEMMEDIYGPDVEDRIPVSVLIERHRNVARKLMLGKKRRVSPEDEFFAERAKPELPN